MKKNSLVALSLLAMMSCSDSINDHANDFAKQRNEDEIVAYVKDPFATTRGSLDGRSIFEAINFDEFNNRDLSGSDNDNTPPEENHEDAHVGLFDFPLTNGLDTCKSYMPESRRRLQEIERTNEFFRSGGHPSTPHTGTRAVYPILSRNTQEEDLDKERTTIRFNADGDADIMWGHIETPEEAIARQEQEEQDFIERTRRQHILQMERKLMRICFVVKRTSEFAPSVINKIEIINVPTNVQMAIKTGEMNWDTATLDTIVAFHSIQRITEEPKVLASFCNIHPQDSVIINIEADGRKYTDHIVPFPSYGRTATRDEYNSRALAQGRLREGTSRVIELTFNPREIETSATIAPWEYGGETTIIVQ